MFGNSAENLALGCFLDQLAELLEVVFLFEFLQLFSQQVAVADYEANIVSRTFPNSIHIFGWPKSRSNSTPVFRQFIPFLELLQKTGPVASLLFNSTRRTTHCARLKFAEYSRRQNATGWAELRIGVRS